MKIPKTKEWFPKKADYTHRSSTEGFYAMKFFVNGLGVKVWHKKYGDTWLYDVKLLQGTPGSYVEHSNPSEVFPVQQWGYNMFALVNTLRKIRCYEPKK